MREIIFILNNTPPSKKNSKRILKNFKTGKNFISSSENHNVWHKETFYELLKQRKGLRETYTFTHLIEINYMFGDKRRRDLTNMTDSIMDILVDTKILEDDNVFVCPDIHPRYVGYNPKKPKTEIKIYV